ncbi:MAG: BspA family leucine-rich repeat surface protein [Bacteroidales bacterium]|nr:BspA family leucine-rich repeat surface protein [Bacteroidales bacterium]
MKHLLKNILAPIVALFVAIVAMPQAAQAQTNEAYVVENGSTLTFYYDANKATRTGTVYGIKDKRTDNLNMPAWAGTDADNKENITKVVFDNSFRNYKPTSMKYWFYNYTKVNAIVGLSNLKTDNVTSMSYTFCNCSSLTSLNLSSFNTENVDNMSAMFYGCSSLSVLDLSSFNTSKVTNMTYMFSGCPALKMVNVSSFNTENVVDMSAMFYGCSSLSSLDLSSFNTSKVTDMAYMFSRCSSLKMLDVSSFNTENVIDMRNMFRGCALTKLDLSNFNTAKVRFIQSMFAECLNLTTIYCNDDWNTSKVEYSDYMFSGCKSLKGAVAYDASKVNASMANPTTGYFTAIPLEAYVVENGATLTFYYDANKAKRTGTVYDINAKHADNPNMPAWAGTDANKKANITKVVFDNSFKKYNPTSLKYWFSNYTKVNAIEGLSNIKTDKVTSMGYMFYNCSSLTTMDLTSFNTENVVNMAGMFYGCSSLYGVGLSSFNTSKVTDMAYMFSGCSSLKMLNVSSFNTENVTDMRYMFFGSSALTKLDLSNFNTAKVSFMQSMFAGCSKLTTIYCKDNWNSNVVSTSDDMFKGCTSLKGAVAYTAS